MLSVLFVFLLVLTVSVMVHELAHYYNAKSVGIEVRAFSVGMGPVLWKKMWRGTEWRVSALPLGGYVDLTGMTPEADENGEMHYPKEGFATKNLWQKLWVLVGGVIANFLLGILLLAIVITINPNYRFLTAGITPVETGAIFVSVQEDSYASALGLQADDVVLAINGIDNPDRRTVQEQIRTADKLELRIQRGEQVLELARAWPPEGDDSPILGVQLSPITVEDLPAINFFAALGESSRFVTTALPSLFQGYGNAMGQTMTGQRSADVVGPVGIFAVFQAAVQQGVVQILLVAALINISLAVFNLLPIPGLDGGRMLVAIISAIRGKDFKPEVEATIHFLGFVFIILFAVLLTSGEIGDLFRR